MVVNKGVWLVAVTAVISGFSIFLNSFAVKGFDSSVFTFSKNAVVAVLLLAVILLFKEYSLLKELSRKQWLQLTMIGLLGGSLPFLLFFKGLQMSSGATSSFIHKSLFIFAAALAALMLKERVDKKVFSGAVLILGGTYLMVRPDFNFEIAHLLVLAAVLLWAFENVLSKKALTDLSGNVVAWGRMFFGSAFILAYLALAGKAGAIFAMSLEQYQWIAITSALLFLYVITYYNGLKHISVVLATAILSLGAPITAILSWAFNAGTLSLYGSMGMLAITLGVMILVWQSSELRVHAYSSKIEDK